jgi:hypothetical protein
MGKFVNVTYQFGWLLLLGHSRLHCPQGYVTQAPTRAHNALAHTHIYAHAHVYARRGAGTSHAGVV